MPRNSITAAFFVLVLAIATPMRFAFADDAPPPAVLASLREAKSMDEQGRPEKAISVLDAAICEHCDVGVLFFARAAFKQRANRDKDAIDDLSRTIEIGYLPAMAYASRGLSRLAMGDRIGALADSDMAIKTDPDLGMAYLLRGRIRFEDGHLALASQDYNKALGLGLAAEGYMGRAHCRLEIGDYAAACADATRAFMIDPTDPTPLYIRAIAHSKRGDEEAAVADGLLAKQLEANATR